MRSAVCIAALFAGSLAAADPDLTDYKTVAQAIPARTAKAGPATTSRPAYLGLYLVIDSKSLVVADVAPGSPAEKAGVKVGDLLTQADGKPVADDDALGELVLAKGPDQPVKLQLSRAGQPVNVTATLAPLSTAMAVGPQKAALGVTVTPVKDGEGVTIDAVTPGSVAERVRLQPGEVLLKVDETEIATADKLKEVLAAKKPDDQVTLTLLLAQKQVEMKVRLGAEGAVTGQRAGGWSGRGSNYWTKDKYRVGMILIDYPDVKHNPKITAKAWEDALLSPGRTYKKTATGQDAHGSMHDYYFEQSYKHLKIEGKAFEHVLVSKNRMDYLTGNRQALLTEAMDKIVARDGKDAFKDIDGVFFIFSGGRTNAARGSLYWPHRSSVSYNGRRLSYFICPEGGDRMGNISVFCHEFGHMLGLPDLYARPENPGMEGVGIWCAMANQAGGGKPQHFSAWSKAMLGWVKPTTIDPDVKQKLILGPIEEDRTQCIKIPIRPDGREYFLLENRKKTGFDASLPAEGLLIWRVIGNRPVLEESHGVDGPSGPRLFLTSVPYPSAANNAFTPFTVPSSRPQLGGGAPLYITNITRLADGRVAFQVGYEYQ
ncbi:MAG TPA: M6 family metalloprotease domain-containing protein [Gemmataceae bacterium]|nr:M6 family metalloprotease domain-containing protein [Gemmataceae bacterium]